MKTVGLILAGGGVLYVFGMALFVFPRYRHDPEKLNRVSCRALWGILPVLLVVLVLAAIALL